MVIAWSLFFTGHFVVGLRESFTPNNGIKFQILRVCGDSKGSLALFHYDQERYAAVGVHFLARIVGVLHN